MSDIRFKCPHCAQHFEAPMDMIGDALPCPTCKRQIIVPTEATQSATRTDELQATPAEVESASPTLTTEGSTTSDGSHGLYKPWQHVPFVLGAMLFGGLCIVPLTWPYFLGQDWHYSQALPWGLASAAAFAYVFDKRGRVSLGRAIAAFACIVALCVVHAPTNGKGAFAAGGALGIPVFFLCGYIGIGIAALVPAIRRVCDAVTTDALQPLSLKNHIEEGECVPACTQCAELVVQGAQTKGLPLFCETCQLWLHEKCGKEKGLARLCTKCSKPADATFLWYCNSCQRFFRICTSETDESGKETLSCPFCQGRCWLIPARELGMRENACIIVMGFVLSFLFLAPARAFGGGRVSFDNPASAIWGVLAITIFCITVLPVVALFILGSPLVNTLMAGALRGKDVELTQHLPLDQASAFRQRTVFQRCLLQQVYVIRKTWIMLPYLVGLYSILKFLA